MLEILVIVFLGKKVAGIAEDKGYTGGWFVALFVGCWFLGEIFGAVLGIAVVGSKAAAYGTALLLAMTGATFAFMLTVLLPSVRHDRYDAFGRHAVSGRPRRRRRRDDYDDDYDDPPRPRRRERVVDVAQLEVIDDEEVLDVLPADAPPPTALRKPDPYRDRCHD